MPIRVKRIYQSPDPEDGFRVLGDRLWPRGLSKESAAVDLWRKDLAPSEELRRWFGHDPQRWDEFRRRYLSELENARPDLEALLDRARTGTLTLCYAARDTQHNNALVLRAYLEAQLNGKRKDT